MTTGNDVIIQNGLTTVTWQDYTQSLTTPGTWFGPVNSTQATNVTVNFERSRSWNGTDITGVKPEKSFKYYYYVVDHIKWIRGKPILLPSTLKTSKIRVKGPRKRDRFGNLQPHGYHSVRTYFREYPYNSTYLTWRVSDGYYLTLRYKFGETVTRNSGWPSYASQPALAFDNNDQIKLINKLGAKTKGSEFNMSVFLGEGRQTLEMITSATLRIARAARLARKGDFATAAKTLTAGTSRYPSRNNRGKVASNWLELQYGWLPLLGDMKTGAEQFAHLMEVPFRQRYVVRAEKNQVPTGTPGAWQWKFAGRSLRRQIVAYIDEGPTLPAWSGILDPELVAWELTPFSFVIDWFLPFGDYLEARSAASRLTGTFITTDTLREHYANPTGFYNASAGILEQINANETAYRRVTVDRIVSTTLAVPMPEVKPLNKALSVGHCLNALALMSQAVLQLPEALKLRKR